MTFRFDLGQRVRIDNEFSVFNQYVFPVTERRMTEEETPRNMYLYRGAWFSEDELIEATPNDKTLQKLFTEAMQEVQSYDLLHCNIPYPLLLTAGLYIRNKIDCPQYHSLFLLRDTYKYNWKLPGDEGVQDLCQRILAMMQSGDYDPPFFSSREFIENRDQMNSKILIDS